MFDNYHVLLSNGLASNITYSSHRKYMAETLTVRIQRVYGSTTFILVRWEPL